MKKGVINESRISNGLLEIKITINGKPEWYKASLPLDKKHLLEKNTVCEFEDQNHYISILIVNGTELPLTKKEIPQVEPQNTRMAGNNHSNPNPNPNPNPNSNPNPIQVNSARAPYNFVPVNETVVGAPQYCAINGKNGENNFEGKIPWFDRYHEGLFTGYINLDIETLTTIYIRDAYNLEEEQQANQAQIACKACRQTNCNQCEHRDKRVNPDFFSPGGKPCIPGSSLRGMVRSMLEIASHSKMEYVDNQKYYYRKVAVNGRYQDLMMNLRDRKIGYYPKTKAGWLKKVNSRYAIFPLEKTQIYRVNAYAQNPGWQVGTEVLKKYNFYEISFKPETETVHPHRNGQIPLRYALVGDFEMGHDTPGYENGYLILSGSMGSKKHMHPIIHCPKVNSNPDEIIWLSQEIVESYQNDISRDPNTDLFHMLEGLPGGVPCFYLGDKNNLISIGHTPLFRLAYDKTVWSHIPAKNREFKGIDFTKAIFGDAEKYMGRVFFEDARSVTAAGQYEDTSPKILSAPKPTTIQHYLEQSNNGHLADWNDANNIRGYKIYWHRNTSDNFNGKEHISWKGAISPVYDKQHTIIKPIKTGSHFAGRIRFENLSDKELGALLFVLDLPDGCAHKIGMGKPLGLGSIRIKPNLIKSDRLTKITEDDSDQKRPGRYSKLFDNQSWNTAEDSIEMQPFKKAFAEYLLEHTQKNSGNGEDAYEQYWATGRMYGLKTMLDFELTKLREWTNKTEYMQLNEFKGRILPDPVNMVKSIIADAGGGK